VPNSGKNQFKGWTPEELQELHTALYQVRIGRIKAPRVDRAKLDTVWGSLNEHIARGGISQVQIGREIPTAKELEPAVARLDKERAAQESIWDWATTAPWASRNIQRLLTGGTTPEQAELFLENPALPKTKTEAFLSGIGQTSSQFLGNVFASPLGIATLGLGAVGVGGAVQGNRLLTQLYKTYLPAYQSLVAEGRMAEAARLADQMRRMATQADAIRKAQTAAQIGGYGAGIGFGAMGVSTAGEGIRERDPAKVAGGLGQAMLGFAPVQLPRMLPQRMGPARLLPERTVVPPPRGAAVTPPVAPPPVEAAPATVRTQPVQPVVAPRPAVAEVPSTGIGILDPVPAIQRGIRNLERRLAVETDPGKRAYIEGQIEAGRKGISQVQRRRTAAATTSDEARVAAKEASLAKTMGTTPGTLESRELATVAIQREQRQQVETAPVETPVVPAPAAGTDVEINDLFDPTRKIRGTVIGTDDLGLVKVRTPQGIRGVSPEDISPVGPQVEPVAPQLPVARPPSRRMEPAERKATTPVVAEAPAAAPAAPQSVDAKIRANLPAIVKRLRKGETIPADELAKWGQIVDVPTEGKSNGEIEAGFSRWMKNYDRRQRKAPAAAVTGPGAAPPAIPMDEPPVPPRGKPGDPEAGFVTFDAMFGAGKGRPSRNRLGYTTPGPDEGRLIAGAQSPTAKGADIALAGERPVFYSEVGRQLAPKMSGKMLISDFRNMLPKGSREVAESGILRLLEAKEARGERFITKDAALDLLEQRLPKLQITTRSRTPEAQANVSELQVEYTRLSAEIPRLYETYQNEFARDMGLLPSEARSWLETYVINDLPRDQVLSDLRARVGNEKALEWELKLRELINLQDRHDSISDSLGDMEAIGGPRYEQYTLPGGSNYREVLIRLPVPEGAVERAVGGSEQGSYARAQAREGIFQSSHFPESNIVAHLRVKDRVGPRGEKIYFIEEVQSDWAIALRAQAERSAARRREALPADLPGIDEGAYKPAPPMPFEGNWFELALKHALREAVEGGYDAIAWTTGRQQTQRYNLRHHLSSIEVFRSEHTANPYTTVRGLDKHGDSVINKRFYSEAETAETFGRELGAKLWSQPVGTSKLSGLDLEVGGEAHLRLYDEMIPQFLGRYTQRVGGKPQTTTVKTGSTIDTGFPGEKVHSLSITPEMRRTILRGQPMLSSPPIRPRRGEAGFISARVFTLPVELAVKGVKAVHRAIQAAIPGHQAQTPVQSPRMQQVMAAQRAAALNRRTGAAFIDRFAAIPRLLKRTLYDRFVALDLDSMLMAPELRGYRARVGLPPAEENAYQRARIAHGGGSGPIVEGITRLAEIKQDAYSAGLAEVTTQYLNLKAYSRVWQVLKDRLRAMRAQEAQLAAEQAQAKQVVAFGTTAPVTGARDLVTISNELNEVRASIKDLDGRLRSNRAVPQGYTEADIQTELQGIETQLGPAKFAEVEGLARRVYGLTREALDIAYQGEQTPVLRFGGGIVSPADYQTYVNRGPEYIPMHRIIDDAQGPYKGSPSSPLTVGTQDLIHKLEGSELTNIDPWEAVAKQYALTIKTVARNAVAKSFITMAQRDPTGLGMAIRELKGGAQPGPDEGIIAYFDNGKVTRWAAPQMIADTLRYVDPAGLEVIGGAILNFTQRLFRRTTTGANLAFSLTNAMRDFQDAVLLGKVVRNPKDLDFIMKEFASFFKVLARSPEYRKFLRSGAAFSTLQFNIDPTSFLEKGRELRGPVEHLRRGEIINSVEKLNNAIEQATKLNVYNKLIAKGMSPAEAVWETRNYGGSPDFGAGGTMAHHFNLMVMFFNANVRGLGRTVERLNPVQHPARFGIVLGMAAGMAYALLQHNLKYADEEGKPELLHVSESDRENYFVFIRDETYVTSQGARRHQLFKIPKSHAFKLIYNPIEDIMTKELRQVSGAQITYDIASNLLPGQFRLQQHRLGASIAEGAVSSLNPAVRFPAEQLRGEGGYDTFRRASIVPRRLSDLERQYQFSPTTSPALVSLGRGGREGAITGGALFGTIGGVLYGPRGAAIGSAAGAALGAYGPSPMRTEHGIRTLTGGVGEAAVGAADIAYRKDRPEGKIPLQGDEAVARFPVFGPVFRRFVGSIQDETVKSLEERFYETADNARTAKATFSALRREAPNKAVEYLREPGKLPLVMMHDKLVTVQRKLGQIRDAQQRIRYQGDMPTEARSLQLQKLYKVRVQLLRIAEQLISELERIPALPPATNPAP